MKKFIVYKITCKINNKMYIGQTTETLKQRFSRHMGYQKMNMILSFIEQLGSMELKISI